jgi:hypothetical protein
MQRRERSTWKKNLFQTGEMGAKHSSDAAATRRENRLTALERRVEGAEGHVTCMRAKEAGQVREVPNGSRFVSASAGDLPVQFLLPLFFCDVCDIPGMSEDAGVRAFRACLDAAEMGSLRCVFESAEVLSVWHTSKHITNKAH